MRQFGRVMYQPEQSIMVNLFEHTLQADTITNGCGSGAPFWRETRSRHPSDLLGELKKALPAVDRSPDLAEQDRDLDRHPYLRGTLLLRFMAARSAATVSSRTRCWRWLSMICSRISRSISPIDGPLASLGSSSIKTALTSAPTSSSRSRADGGCGPDVGDAEADRRDIDVGICSMSALTGVFDMVILPKHFSGLVSGLFNAGQVQPGELLSDGGSCRHFLALWGGLSE